MIGSRLTWFKIDVIFSIGIELDFVFVRGPKPTSVWSVGQKLHVFNLWIEIDLASSVGIKN